MDFIVFDAGIWYDNIAILPGGYVFQNPSWAAVLATLAAVAQHNVFPLSMLLLLIFFQFFCFYINWLVDLPLHLA